MYKPAKEPNDLEKYFVERANNGDIEGLLALYESNAVLDCGDGRVFIGIEQIRDYFVEFLAQSPQLSSSNQSPALNSGDLALTSSRLCNGDITAEVARQQPDGTWLWVIDQFQIANISQNATWPIA